MWQRLVHLFEGEAQDGDVLATNGVEHGLDDTPHKPLLLVVIDLHHLVGQRTLASSDRCVATAGQGILINSYDQFRTVCFETGIMMSSCSWGQHQMRIVIYSTYLV